VIGLEVRAIFEATGDQLQVSVEKFEQVEIGIGKILSSAVAVILEKLFKLDVLAIFGPL